MLLVGGPVVGWKVFLAREDWKNEFSEVQTSFGPGDQLMFRQKKTIGYISLLIQCLLLWWIKQHRWLEMVFFLYRSVFRFKFLSYCTFTDTVEIGFHNWFDRGVIDFEFFVGICFVLSSYSLHGPKYAKNAHLCSLLTTSTLSTINSRGILVCSFDVPVHLGPRNFP